VPAAPHFQSGSLKFDVPQGGRGLPLPAQAFPGPADPKEREAEAREREAEARSRGRLPHRADLKPLHRADPKPLHRADPMPMDRAGSTPPSPRPEVWNLGAGGEGGAGRRGPKRRAASHRPQAIRKESRAAGLGGLGLTLGGGPCAPP
jgi:hypothetical protein